MQELNKVFVVTAASQGTHWQKYWFRCVVTGIQTGYYYMKHGHPKEWILTLSHSYNWNPASEPCSIAPLMQTIYSTRWLSVPCGLLSLLYAYLICNCPYLLSGISTNQLCLRFGTCQHQILFILECHEILLLYWLLARFQKPWNSSLGWIDIYWMPAVSKVILGVVTKTWMKLVRDF